MRWRYFWLILLGAWFIIRETLDGYGRIQAAKEIFASKGKLMASFGIFLTWRWAPIIVFAVLFIGFVFIQSLPTLAKIISPKEQETTPSTQTATASGNAAINQVGGNQTIGISESTMLKLLSDKATSRDEMLRDRYPLGCVLLGILDDSKIVYHFVGPLRLTKTDLQVIMSDTRILIFINDFEFDVNGASLRCHDMSLQAEYEENQPKPWPFGGTFHGQKVRPYFEVLDKENRVCVIGLKPE